MFNISNIYRISIVLFVSVLVVSCKQQPAGNVAGDNTETVDTTSVVETDIPATARIPAVTLSETSIQITKGDTVSIDVVMKGFPLTEGGGVTVRYNPGLLQANEVTVNTDSWSFVNRSGVIDNTAGVISNILVSSYKGVSGDDIIATIEFTAINSGNSEIELELSTENPFSADGSEIVVQFDKSDITVLAEN